MKLHGIQSENRSKVKKFSTIGIDIESEDKLEFTRNTVTKLSDELEITMRLTYYSFGSYMVMLEPLRLGKKPSVRLVQWRFLNTTLSLHIQWQSSVETCAECALYSAIHACSDTASRTNAGCSFHVL